MASTDELLPKGEKMRKTVRWISEMVQQHPEKSRKKILQEAETRFDLSPKECTFLNAHFGDDICKPS
jgi:hypothetical protein